MKQLWWIGLFFVVVSGLTGCNKGEDSAIARAKAEAEVARLRIEAAQAEVAAAKANEDRLAAEERAKKEQRAQEADMAAKLARSDEENRQRVGQHALGVIQRNGREILNKAYPMAFGRLQFRSGELMGVGSTGSGYLATIRLNYVNLLGRNQYLVVAFEFDSSGGYRENRVVDHSDSIAPGEITVAKMMEVAGY